jgi:hypothetical protein
MDVLPRDKCYRHCLIHFFLCSVFSVLSDPAKRLEYDLSGCYELNRYTLREYLTRFKGMILTCNGLGIDHSSKWARHLRELEPH